MRYIFTGRQMKEIDNYTINTTKIPSLVLMERASYEVAKEIMKRFGKEERIVVVCGNGNNGADGMCTARILSEYGYQASYIYEFDAKKATDELRTQLTICENEGIKRATLSEISTYSIIVDAIFGIGCTREVLGVYKELIELINEQQAYKIALDVPSGINSENAKVMKVAIKADMTITFGYEKYGIFMYPGKNYAGEIVIKKAGFSKKAINQFDRKIYTFDKNDLSNIPRRDQASNKGTYGKLLVIAGSKNMGGAAYFAAAAAYRSGSGLVRILTHSANKVMLNMKVPEAITETYDTISDDEIRNLVAISDAVIIGPGIGTDSEAYRIMSVVLSCADIPVIIDADGINVLAKNRELLDITHDNPVIITPHIGEMHRLCKMSISDIKDNLVTVCTDIAKELHVICVLKDARTVVGREDGDIYINSSGNSGMSTGGSGDVLTGIIAGLILNGMQPYEAAEYGVYIHGLSGDVMAKEKSERSLMASDIIEGIGRII